MIISEIGQKVQIDVSLIYTILCGCHINNFVCLSRSRYYAHTIAFIFWLALIIVRILRSIVEGKSISTQIQNLIMQIQKGFSQRQIVENYKIGRAIEQKEVLDN